MKKIFYILFLLFLVPSSSNSFFGEKWQGWVYPDRTNLRNSISVGKDFKSLTDCRAACVNRINSSGYKNTQEAIEFINSVKVKNSLILLKGSRGIALEKIIDFL